MIEFKWYDKNLNVMIENNTINKIKNWQNKIKEIKDDLEKDKIFKINMYPHTFYFDDEDNAHIMDHMVAQIDTADIWIQDFLNL